MSLLVGVPGSVFGCVVGLVLSFPCCNDDRAVGGAALLCSAVAGVWVGLLGARSLVRTLLLATLSGFGLALLGWLVGVMLSAP